MQRVPVVAFNPADKSLLKAGAKGFIIAQQAARSSLVALCINVGNSGHRERKINSSLVPGQPRSREHHCRLVETLLTLPR